MSRRSPSRRLLVGACGTALAVAAIAPGAASAATPASGYEQFAGCPNREDIQACQVFDWDGGSFGLGTLAISAAPGVNLAGGASNTDLGSFLVSDDGDVLTPVELPVTGGVGGLVGDAAAGSDAVVAVPRLTSDPEFTENGFRLKVSFGFSGAGLPDGCAIGTDAEPVVLDLTNATTTPPEGVAPITGDAGDQDVDILRLVISSKNATFVDNGYAVPAASGCGSTIGGRDVGSVDGLINASAGLPAAAGTSVTTASNATAQAAFDLTKVFGS